MKGEKVFYAKTNKTNFGLSDRQSLIAFLITFTGAFNKIDKSAGDVLYHHAGKPDAKIKIIKKMTVP